VQAIRLFVGVRSGYRENSGFHVSLLWDAGRKGNPAATTDASIFNNFLSEPNPWVYTELTPLYTMWMKYRWRRCCSRNAKSETARPSWLW
jgi:hypothetical protein